MKFGTKRVTAVLDDNGSTRSADVSIVSGEPVKPLRVYSAIRHRVESDQEARKIQNEYTDMCERHDEWLDVRIEREKPIRGKLQGYYFIVLHYTELKDPNRHQDLVDLLLRV